MGFTNGWWDWTPQISRPLAGYLVLKINNCVFILTNVLKTWSSIWFFIAHDYPEWRAMMTKYNM